MHFGQMPVHCLETIFITLPEVLVCGHTELGMAPEAFDPPAQWECTQLLTGGRWSFHNTGEPGYNCGAVFFEEGCLEYWQGSFLEKEAVCIDNMTVNPTEAKIVSLKV